MKKSLPVFLISVISEIRGCSLVCAICGLHLFGRGSAFWPRGDCPLFYNGAVSWNMANREGITDDRALAGSSWTLCRAPGGRGDALSDPPGLRQPVGHR